MLSRAVTGPIGWVLDNLLPPILRDSRLFMWPAFRLLFGAKAPHFMSFKDEAPFLSKREFRDRYALLADVHLQRDSDLSGEVLARVLAEVRGESALDVGSGRGHLARALSARLPGAVVGIDLFTPRPEGRPAFTRGDAEALPVRARSFDTVLCCHTLEHVQDAAAVVAELRRVAHRRLIVVVPRQREYPFTFDLHVRFFPYPFSLQQLMRRPGARCEPCGSDLVYVEDVEDVEGPVAG
jgi:SAM-dependent methyltransferase